MLEIFLNNSVKHHLYKILFQLFLILNVRFYYFFFKRKRSFSSNI